MKKYIFTFVAICMLGYSAIGQITTESYLKNELRLGFFQFFNNGMQIQYENYLQENKSLVYIGELNWAEDDYQVTKGIMGELQFRYYGITDLPFLGIFNLNLYMAPAIRYRFWHFKDNEYGYNYGYSGGTYNWTTTQINTGMINILLGSKLMIGKKVSLDFNIGGGLKIADISRSAGGETHRNDIFSPGYSGIQPAGNFSIGMRF